MKKQTGNSNSPKNKNKNFLIAAIGASAGGIEAVNELLKYLSPNTGIAFVYIQHLAPAHESHLASVLAKSTQMKVAEAKHLMVIEPDNVYVIPADKDMAIVDGVIILNTRKEKPSLHLPIDQFFTSLAENHKEASIGVVLSGNAHDGTVGLRAIKTAGGITFAQDDSALFKSMPTSAISEGVVDMVLSPAEIAKELERIGKQANLFGAIKNETEDEEAGADVDLRNIIQLLRKSTGVDFAHYKMNTIKRRIVRRMVLYKLETLKDYTQYIKQHTNEINTLYNDLLINVTSFFRDPDAIEYLKKSLLPAILKNKSPNDPVRIWIPACSTGEEAYSLAMIIMEILGDNIANTAVQIFATDLSDLAIAKARLGVYTRNDLINVSPKRIQRFFTKTDGSYRIIKSIRDLCIFAPHNIFKDPPFSRLDFISCCNLLIYLDDVLQKKVLATFHYALNNNGYLMLGKSETIGSSGQLFTQLEKKYKIYAKKKETEAKALFEMSHRVTNVDRVESSAQRAATKETGNIAELEKLIDNVLLSNYVPACVVVNKELEILQFRGSTSAFIEPSPGRASFHLMKMARPGLAFELRNAIHKANKTGESIKKSGLQVKNKNTSIQAGIEVIPVKSENEEKLFIVVFEETKEPTITQIKAEFSKDKYIKQLQDELNAVREDMRAIVEDQEAANEELQSANEEIVSSNEELQSINEELETSKEEVESTNEELMTINSELQVRNEQLAESYEYAEAVFATMREALIVLDQNLRVKTANRTFYKLFEVKEEDTEGTLIYELGNKQWNIPTLKQMLDDIILHNSQFEGYEVTHNFPGIGQKVMLLNAKKIVQKIHHQQLILLAIQDISEHKHAEQLIKEREEWFRNMADNAPVMIWIAGSNKQGTFFNKTWLEFTGRTIEQEKGNGWIENVYEDDLGDLLKKFHSSFDEKKSFKTEFRLKRYDGEYRWIMATGKPTYSIVNEFTGYTITLTDVHDQKLTMEELDKLVSQRTNDLQEINKELERSNNELQQFAYVASHDLQEPLRKIITFSDRLEKHKENLPDKAKNYTEKISSSADRMTRLIDDLLNFSKIASNKKFENTDLNKILKDVLADFEVVTGEKKARITHNNLPVIQAIPLQMEQLFHNLISNSLKFSKEDTSPVITITSRSLSPRDLNPYPQLDKSKKYCEITVEDNGIGFSNEFAEQIFVIFQRLEDQKNYPGTGIGLALVRKIINNHGGAIKAESRPDEGATFKIILPEKQVEGGR